ncbi:MAG: zinc ribbon domain-containing protein [Desulfovibrionaceae bacterium]|nr:zinc ribbon domain-containing protein [Desulfovibrionaceae bacterium]
MPLYDFHCTACDADFEEIVKENADNPLCPSCGSRATERKIAMPAPLKTGAFPFKVGPVRPMSMGGGPSCASCSKK